MLKKHGIDRSRYHGGSFNGANIIKIMQHLTLVDDLETILAESGRESEQKVKELCTDVKSSLRAWDSIFSRIHQSNPTEDFCIKLQADIAMAQWRALGLSVTPKLHGLECHVVPQMRSFGGMKELLEYWVEQEHQIGNRKDIDWMSQSFASQATLVRDMKCLHGTNQRLVQNKLSGKSSLTSVKGFKKRRQSRRMRSKRKVGRKRLTC